MSDGSVVMDTIAECMRVPGRSSIWSSRLGKYVCSADPEYKVALLEQSKGVLARRPPISAAFKLVFWTAAGGTLLFIAICISVTFATKGEMPDPLDRLITGLFDLAKIGFGAIVGMLGGQTLRAEVHPTE